MTAITPAPQRPRPVTLEDHMQGCIAVLIPDWQQFMHEVAEILDRLAEDLRPLCQALEPYLEEAASRPQPPVVLGRYQPDPDEEIIEHDA